MTRGTDKTSVQLSSKNLEKVPGAVIITGGMVDEEKENSTIELSPSIAPLAVQESLEERAKPAATTATTNTSVPSTTSTTKDASSRAVCTHKKTKQFVLVFGVYFY